MGKIEALCAIGFAALFLALPAFADSIDRDLPSSTTERLRASARQMIRSGIDAEDALKMTRLMVQDRFEEEPALRAHEIVMNAHQEGLPTEPIMNKLYEGMAKRVPDKDIVQAMEKVHARYAFAFEQASLITRERVQIRSLGHVVAQGLASGMTDDGMKTIMATLQQRTQEMAQAEAAGLSMMTLNAARDMARLGVSSGLATDVVCQALTHGYTEKQMERMSHSFMDHALHSPPVRVAKTYAHAIREGVDAENLGSLVGHGEGMDGSRHGEGFGNGGGMGPGGSGHGEGPGHGGSSGSGHGGGHM